MGKHFTEFHLPPERKIYIFTVTRERNDIFLLPKKAVILFDCDINDII